MGPYQSTLSPGNKQLAALQQLVREEKDAKNIHDLNALYLYKTRQLVHCGEISTGKHLNHEKSFLEVRTTWNQGPSTARLHVCIRSLGQGFAALHNPDVGTACPPVPLQALHGGKS